MSYGIQFFLCPAGEDPIEAAFKSPEESAAPLTPEHKARNAKITAALLAHSPWLEVEKSEDGTEIYDEEIGITISLFNQEGGIDIAYWHDENAKAMLGRVSEYLLIVAAHSNFLFFDPQTGELITKDSNFTLSVKEYARGVKALHTILESQKANDAAIRSRFFKRYIAWLPVLLILAGAKYFYYQARIEAKTSTLTHQQAPVDDAAPAAMYTLSAAPDLTVTRSTLAENPRMLTWVIQENGATVLERNATNEISYRYYRLQAGNKYKVHLKAAINGGYHIVSNSVTLTP